MKMLMHFKTTLIISLLSISCFLNACSSLETVEQSGEKSVKQSVDQSVDQSISPSKLTERDQIFAAAEEFFKNQKFDSAKNLFLRLSRNKEGAQDPLYDKSLWYLSKIYENTNEIEKALLSLDELVYRKSTTISKNKIKFSQMRYQFLLTNYVQGKEIKKELDDLYKKNLISLNDLFEYLEDTTSSIDDHFLLEELMFVGEAQKYFIFIMESQQAPENEQSTEKLIKIYEHFFTALKHNKYSNEFKKKLTISLFDQLNKFNHYKLDTFKSENSELNNNTITIFYEYSMKKQKILTEGFYK